MSLTHVTEARPRLSGPARAAATPPALRLLSGLAPLTGAEFELVRRCALRSERVQTGAVLHPGGDKIVPRLILAGWACRVRELPDGRRQILGFLLPGDAIGLGACARPLDRAPVVALTRVDSADASSLAVIVGEGRSAHQGLARAVETAAELELERLLNQLVRLGRQSAYERTAAWLLETRARFARAGLVENDAFPLPITQETLGEALGLSVVHVNRTLQQLRREGLLELRTGKARLPDPDRLAEVAGA